MPTKAEDSAEVRSEVAKKLLEAIRTADELAQKAGEESRGKHGAPPKVRWYQVMGYLAQTLDGLLRNADLNETKKDLAELQRMVVQLQDRTSKTKARTRNSHTPTGPVQGP